MIHVSFVTVDGALFTFGERDSGKLGLTTEKLANHRVPQQVTGISDRVVQVACGGGHTVALTGTRTCFASTCHFCLFLIGEDVMVVCFMFGNADHELYSFGLGQFGQLGHGTFIFEARLPRAVEHFRRGRVTHVECGENHTAVITGQL